MPRPSRDPSEIVPVDKAVLWTIEEAAAAIRMSPDFLEKSDCPYVPMGRARRYDPEQVRAYVRARRTHEVGQ